MPDNRNNRSLIIAVVVIIVALVVYSVLTMPDRRNGFERVGDAIHELPQGPEKAARQLEKRTPGEKLGDAVEDAGEDLKRATDNNPATNP